LRLNSTFERKAHGKAVVTQAAPAERPHRVINLMEALQKSIDSARQASEKKSPHKPTSKKSGEARARNKKRTA